MTSIKTVIYIGNEPTVSDLFKKAIQEKNTLFSEYEYSIIHETELIKDGFKNIERLSPDIVILDDTVTDMDLISGIKELLIANNQLKLVLSITMNHYKIKEEIQKLQIDYPLSIVYVLIKPIQPADLWTFLEKVEKSQENMTWEDGDFDEF